MKSYANSLQRCSGKIDAKSCKGAVELDQIILITILDMRDDRHWLSEMSQNESCCYCTLNVFVTVDGDKASQQMNFIYQRFIVFNLCNNVGHCSRTYCKI